MESDMNNKWNNIKRIFFFFVSIGLWIAGFKFSVAGFNFEAKDIVWVAWVFGATVTAFELAFTSEIKSKKRNLTTYILGILGYIYGVGTNFIGLWVINHASLDDVLSDPISAFFILIVALIAEIGPEVLMVIALGVNNENGEGDIVKNLMHTGSWNGNSNSGGGGNQNNQNRGGGNQNNRSNMPPIERMERSFEPEPTMSYETMPERKPNRDNADVNRGGQTPRYDPTRNRGNDRGGSGGAVLRKK